MVKLIGVLLILSSLLSLVGGAFIDWKYERDVGATGNVIVNIVTQPKINLGFLEYIEAIAFSYSIFSFIVGIVFLIKM